MHHQDGIRSVLSFSVILERSMEPGWLSNSLPRRRPPGRQRRADRRRRAADAARRRDRAPPADRHAHPRHAPPQRPRRARRRLPRRATACPCWRTRSRPRRPAAPTRRSRDGDVVESGGMRIEALHTPGHTAGMLAFVVDGPSASRATRSSRARSAACARPATTSSRTCAARSWTRSWSSTRRACSTRATSATRPSRASGRRTPSCGSGAGSTSEGSEPCRVALGEPGRPR